MARSRASATVFVRWATIPDDDLVANRVNRLPDAEGRRAAEFRSGPARRAHVAGRIMRRRLLAAELDVPPDDLVFETDPRGKPVLAPARAAGLAFNLSHSRHLVALAWARTATIGLDLEVVRPMAAAERLARRFFSPAEQDAIMARTGDDRDRLLLTLWTRKEAWLKATGRGISVRLAEVEVEPEPRRAPRLLGLPHGCGDHRDWHLLAPDLGGATACTVCLAAGSWSLEVARWDWD
jgi:4'-phosphopantetheinyl transferase